MRDLILTLIIFGSIPFIIVRPHIGILMWSWVSFMSPHRLAYGFAYDFPFALVIAVTTIAAWLISKESKKVPWEGISISLLLLLIWTNVTTAFALSPDSAFELAKKFDKVLLMAFLTILLMNSEVRLRWLIWITVGAIGFYAIKGGFFTIVTGGEYRVWGPAHSFISGNNELAMASLMVAPLMYYLATVSENKWLRWALYGCAGLTVVSAVGSYSRGALVGLVVGGFVFWLRSNRKMIISAVIVVGLIGALPLMPDKWFERMQTIETYQEDGSAQIRLKMWNYAINVALDRPLFGGGWGIISDTRYYHKYEGDFSEGVPRARAAHSVYFDMLGSHGVPGLVLFIILGLSAWRAGNWVRRRCHGVAELAGEHRLASMLQVSIAVYAVCGAFLSLSLFDLYYTLLGMLLLLKWQVARKIDEPQPEPLGASSRPGAPLPILQGANRSPAG